MDEICMMFNLRQICGAQSKYVPSPHAYGSGLLKYNPFSKKHTTVQVHKLHVVPFNESSKERWQMEKVAARCSN